jgi:CheY-like chemotaxis protein
MFRYDSLQQTRDARNIPLELSSILLVEPDPELRAARRLLLGLLQHPVLAVATYKDVCRLPTDSNCCLVAVDINPSEHEALRIAVHVRRTWPGAKILLLGSPSENFDDPLYDDSVTPSYNPAGVIETAKRLLTTGHGPD